MGLFVGSEDSLAAKKATLLSTVPVELDGVFVVTLENVLGLEENTESLQDGDGTAAIVISARGSENGREPKVDRVLVRADNNGGIGLAGNGSNDAVLAPSVLEVAGSNDVVRASLLDGVTNLLEKPFARLTSALGLLTYRG